VSFIPKHTIQVQDLPSLEEIAVRRFERYKKVFTLTIDISKAKELWPSDIAPLDIQIDYEGVIYESHTDSYQLKIVDADGTHTEQKLQHPHRRVEFLTSICEKTYDNHECLEYLSLGLVSDQRKRKWRDHNALHVYTPKDYTKMTTLVVYQYDDGIRLRHGDFRFSTTRGSNLLKGYLGGRPNADLITEHLYGADDFVDSHDFLAIALRDDWRGLTKEYGSAIPYFIHHYPDASYMCRVWANPMSPALYEIYRAAVADFKNLEVPDDAKVGLIRSAREQRLYSLEAYHIDTIKHPDLRDALYRGRSQELKNWTVSEDMTWDV